VKKKRKDYSDTRVALLMVGSSISDCRKHWREREEEEKGREKNLLSVADLSAIAETTVTVETGLK